MYLQVGGVVKFDSHGLLLFSWDPQFFGASCSLIFCYARKEVDNPSDRSSPIIRLVRDEISY